MPIYAYLCRDCGHAFDVRQEFSDAALTTCDTCGGALRKQFGSIGVTFNGGGFYRTDSRSESGSSASSTSGTSKGTASAAPKSEPATSTPPA